MEIQSAYYQNYYDNLFKNHTFSINTGYYRFEYVVTECSVKIDNIVNIVIEYFNIPIENFKSKTRKRAIVQARQIAMFFSKKLTSKSLATIGLEVGNKDHATVLHACKVVNNLIDTDRVVRKQVDDIEQLINNFKK